jgi:nucleoside phosphorylase
MDQVNSPKSAEAYTVAWITALFHERAAGKAMFDEEYKDSPPGFSKNSSDPNAYSWGRMGKHHVVLCSLPEGEYGTNVTATIAQGLRSSLPHIRIGLLVGIGAGVPGEQVDKGNDSMSQPDIRLGDVVVSKPDGTSGGIIQVDLFKATSSSHGEAQQRKGFLNSPPMALRTALTKIRSDHEIEDSQIQALLSQAFERRPKLKANFSHPGLCESEEDRAIDMYVAKDGTKVVRAARDPEVHYGIIASSNTLVKSSRQRNEMLARLNDENITPMCFEMEAAGLMNSFPCIVIRGICDYADENKNDLWQKYAAITAAAYAKEYLQYVDREEVRKGLAIDDLLMGQS